VALKTHYYVKDLLPAIFSLIYQIRTRRRLRVMRRAIQKALREMRQSKLSWTSYWNFYVDMTPLNGSRRSGFSLSTPEPIGANMLTLLAQTSP
jgi:hypothetical protein